MRIYTTTVLVVDGSTLLSLVLVFGDKEGNCCIDDDLNHNHSTLPNYYTRCCWGCSLLSLVLLCLYLLCGTGRQFQAQSFGEDL